MHEEILSDKQKNLLPLLRKFRMNFGLVGGTAIALQLGHRRSIDYDLFTNDDLNIDGIKAIIKENHKIDLVSVENPNELTVFVDGVKITFLKYPFKINFSVNFSDYINMPDLTTLSIMKAFALGRRAKWKDYVDLYFVFKKLSFNTIIEGCKELFLGEFNEKLFREQLSYYNDVDHTEKITYMKGFDVLDDEIEKNLTKISLQK